MRTQRTQKGFTIIELMIIVGIVGVLASLAIPAYSLYQNRSRFSEALIAIGDTRSSILAAAQKERFAAINDIDAGTNGIAPAQVQAATTHGIDVVDGTITVTWRADGTALAGVTYSLTAQGVALPVQWVKGGSCVALGYC